MKMPNMNGLGVNQALSKHYLISSSQQPQKLMLSAFHFTEEETEAQRG